MDATTDVAARSAEAARTSYGRLVALLATDTRDLATAEDVLADAFERALRTWPTSGVPDNPEGWLLTVARNRLRDTGIPFVVPTRADLPGRREAVLEAIYGAYAIEWQVSGAQERTSLADEARYLAVLLASLLDDAEACGLASLISFAASRAAAREVDTPSTPPRR